MTRRRIKLVEATGLGQHRLHLRFSDGSEGITDLSDLLREPAFAALRDPDVFADFDIDHGTLEWPDAEVGLAVEFLHARANALPEPRTREEAHANALTVSLQQLRKLAGRTQVQVAESTGVTQATIAGIERREDHKLSVLRTYVESLGGSLEVVAEVNGIRYTLNGV